MLLKESHPANLNRKKDRTAPQKLFDRGFLITSIVEDI